MKTIDATSNKEPHCESTGWDGESLIAIAEILNIDTTGIDWRRSKTRRPV